MHHVSLPGMINDQRLLVVDDVFVVRTPVVVGKRDLCFVGHCKGGLRRHIKRNVIDPVRVVVV